MVVDDVYSVGLVVGFYVWVDGVEVADYGGGVLDLLLLVISCIGIIVWVYVV